jgi:beta-galactosidase
MRQFQFSKQFILSVFAALLLPLTSTATAQIYIPPANHRIDTVIDSNWRFIRQDVSGAQNTIFDDSAWSVVNLPHTWNNLDGQDGGNNYYRGIGWYRTHFTIDNSYVGRRIFLKFDGAFLVSDVYLDGAYLGEHQGGFAAFVFDATPYVSIGGDNVIAVKVNNAANTNIPPLNADFTFFGGIYRDVHLLVTDPVQISPLDYSSPGVYLQTTAVSSNSANLQVTTVVSNATASAQSVVVRAVITDAVTNIVATITNLATLPAASSSNVIGSTVIVSPHLWDGLADPYLYRAFVELSANGNVVDVVQQPLGFRSFSVDPTNGFFLNGHHYDLHGADMHQDWFNCGWALTNAQRDINFSFIKEIGATAVRLSHYEHDDYTYQLGDENGVLLWSEIPLIDYITESPAFYANAKQQLIEMIRQRYNHPSVFAWSVYNEITLQSGPSTTNLISQLARLEAAEDPTRPSTAAANASDGDPSTLLTKLIDFNKYFGWYNGVITDFGPWADNIHATYPARTVGVAEYGAGASIYQHSENPVSEPANAGPYHPEEYQNLYHESYWQQMKARPFLWSKFIWNLFDFASDGRSEGDAHGRNDKGLVTYDRQVRKDSFYWYKANWSTNPMVYITGHTFTNRLTNFVTAKVYANCDSVELFLNGASLGAQTSTNCIFTWPATLQGGTNVVLAVGSKGSTQVTDSLVWIAPTQPPHASILSPVTSIVYLHDSSQVLLLSASVSNTVPGNSLTFGWKQTSGDGSVTFGNSNSLSTSAAFSSNGVYGLEFTADNGGTTNVDLVVIVNPTLGVTNGLIVWWKMDETGGATAFDSSGNGINATLGGSAFTAGYLSNALTLNGATSDATFASPDSSQITVAAWVRADGQGNSPYPRILDTPGYRLFFRFDNQGTNGLDFATYSTVNGDWFSGANTISTGSWYHVAACYDRGSFANKPTLYVNGTKVSPATITSPSGTQPPYSGTGYIGNKSGLNRAWKGAVDDLRIYNRLLTDAEIKTLASMPPANLAPVVNAGTNLNVVSPGSIKLSATVTDDGEPNPPGAPSLTWSEISGPAGVTFGSSNALTTTVSFPTAGEFILRLIADDGAVQTAQNLLVTVISQPVISTRFLSNTFQMSWQTTGGNWLLQYRTNLLNAGSGTQWQTMTGAVLSPFAIPISTGADSMFYRLALTN